MSTRVDAGGDEGVDPGEPSPSVARLREASWRFLRGFGLLSAVWTVLLVVTAPTDAHRTPLVVTAVAVATWAVASQFVPPVAWWWGWFVAATVLEWTGPVAGTQGWSVTGGGVLLVLFGVVLWGRRRWVVATTAGLVVIGLVRPLIGEGWPVERALNTAMFIVFGAVGVTWLFRAIERVARDRDRLSDELLEVRTRAARAMERAEAGARLHDTVLQHLTAVGRASDLYEARRHAGRASNDLRMFLRSDRDEESTRRLLQDAATTAADGAEISVSVAGDRPAGHREQLLVAAAAEAVRNAVVHGVPPVRLHAEFPGPAGQAGVVWVVDQGDGFDLGDVPADRLGVRESIIGRLDRAGGTATLEVGDTTEWELRLPPDQPAGQGN